MPQKCAKKKTNTEDAATMHQTEPKNNPKHSFKNAPKMHQKCSVNAPNTPQKLQQNSPKNKPRMPQECNKNSTKNDAYPFKK